jgi:hypothetical protein
MQKLSLLSILVFSGVLGITLAWSQLAFVQASSNESGTIQCITTPCEFPPSQTTSNESGTIQCITNPCDHPSSQPLPTPPKSDSNNDTVTGPRNGIELPSEEQNSSNQIEPCLSPCPPEAEMCIQMCKPIDQQGTTNQEIESQSDPQQEAILSSVPDKSLSGTTTLEQSNIEDEAETTDSESTESSESIQSSN